MNYLGNALSLGMLDDLAHGRQQWLRTMASNALDAQRILHGWSRAGGWESCVGHADTAELFSALLGIDVPLRRVTTSLRAGDTMLVGQYTGPRLPEGAKSLPEGAKLRWIVVEVMDEHQLPQPQPWQHIQGRYTPPDRD